MAETFKCAFVILAFVTSFQILFIEGRPIKPTNKQQLPNHEKEPLKEMASKTRNTNLHHSTADNQKVYLTSPPVHIPSVHHSKADRKQSQPMVPRSSDSPSVRHTNTPGANSNNGHSVNAFKDDFKPTTPGHSPGVGHIHADEDQDDSEDVDPKAPGSGSSTGRAGAAFKPTKPGHSPGVGHMSSVEQSDKTDPKASNFEHSVTAPGHSPGFGHILAGQDQDDSEDVDSKAPGSGSSTGRAGAAFKPTTPGHSPGIGHMSSVNQSEKTDLKPSNIEHSVTTAGHNHGVGHILADEDQDDNEDVDSKAPGSGSSTGRAGAAFKPTKPGHSPGAGHMSSVDQSDKTDPKAFNFEHSVTTPGHSPGFGHILAGEDQDDSEDDSKEPGSGSSIGRAGAAFKPTTPGHSPGIGHMSSVDQSDKTDLRPSNIEHSVTTPSHSHGVGHILVDEDQDDNEDVDPKAPGSGSSTGRAGAAFKPTKPGHSPGAGHMSSVDQSDKTESNFEHSVTRVPDDFQPTLPGHSIGVGHIFEAQTKN